MYPVRLLVSLEYMEAMIGQWLKGFTLVHQEIAGLNLTKGILFFPLLTNLPAIYHNAEPLCLIHGQ